MMQRDRLTLVGLSLFFMLCIAETHALTQHMDHSREHMAKVSSWAQARREQHKVLREEVQNMHRRGPSMNPEGAHFNNFLQNPDSHALVRIQEGDLHSSRLEKRKTSTGLSLLESKTKASKALVAVKEKAKFVICATVLIILVVAGAILSATKFAIEQYTARSRVKLDVLLADASGKYVLLRNHVGTEGKLLRGIITQMNGLIENMSSADKAAIQTRAKNVVTPKLGDEPAFRMQGTELKSAAMELVKKGATKAGLATLQKVAWKAAEVGLAAVGETALQAIPVAKVVVAAGMLLSTLLREDHRIFSEPIKGKMQMLKDVTGKGGKKYAKGDIVKLTDLQEKGIDEKYYEQAVDKNLANVKVKNLNEAVDIISKAYCNQLFMNYMSYRIFAQSEGSSSGDNQITDECSKDLIPAEKKKDFLAAMAVMLFHTKASFCSITQCKDMLEPTDEFAQAGDTYYVEQLRQSKKQGDEIKGQIKIALRDPDKYLITTCQGTDFGSRPPSTYQAPVTSYIQALNKLDTTEENMPNVEDVKSFVTTNGVVFGVENDALNLYAHTEINEIVIKEPGGKTDHQEIDVRIKITNVVNMDLPVGKIKDGGKALQLPDSFRDAFAKVEDSITKKDKSLKEHDTEWVLGKRRFPVISIGEETNSFITKKSNKLKVRIFDVEVNRKGYVRTHEQGKARVMFVVDQNGLFYFGCQPLGVHTGEKKVRGCNGLETDPAEMIRGSAALFFGNKDENGGFEIILRMAAYAAPEVDPDPE